MRRRFSGKPERVDDDARLALELLAHIAGSLDVIAQAAQLVTNEPDEDLPF